MPKQTIDFTVDACPVCAGHHSYHLNLGTTYLFRGQAISKAQKGLRYLDVILECPVKGVQFKAEISIPLEDYLWIAEIQAKHKTQR